DRAGNAVTPDHVTEQERRGPHRAPEHDGPRIVYLDEAGDDSADAPAKRRHEHQNVTDAFVAGRRRRRGGGGSTHEGFLRGLVRPPDSPLDAISAPRVIQHGAAIVAPAPDPGILDPAAAC